MVASDTILTVRYFVIAPDGSRFGPADLATLRAWAAQGRIAPDTILEEEASHQRVAARLVAGLTFPEMPAGMAQTDYLRSPKTEYTKGFDDGSHDVLWSYICSLMTMICCCFFGIGGFVYANRAISKGNRRGYGARAFAFVMCGLWILTTLITIPFIGQLYHFVINLLHQQQAAGGLGE